MCARARVCACGFGFFFRRPGCPSLSSPLFSSSPGTNAGHGRHALALGHLPLRHDRGPRAPLRGKAHVLVRPRRCRRCRCPRPPPRPRRPARGSRWRSGSRPTCRSPTAFSRPMSCPAAAWVRGGGARSGTCTAAGASPACVAASVSAPGVVRHPRGPRGVARARAEPPLVPQRHADL